MRSPVQRTTRVAGAGSFGDWDWDWDWGRASHLMVVASLVWQSSFRNGGSQAMRSHAPLRSSLFVSLSHQLRDQDSGDTTTTGWLTKRTWQLERLVAVVKHILGEDGEAAVVLQQHQAWLRLILSSRCLPFLPLLATSEKKSALFSTSCHKTIGNTPEHSSAQQKHSAQTRPQSSSSPCTRPAAPARWCPPSRPSTRTATPASPRRRRRCSAGFCPRSRRPAAARPSP